jgi:putative protease
MVKAKKSKPSKKVKKVVKAVKSKAKKTVKRIVKKVKAVKKAVLAKKSPAVENYGKEVGVITHFFDQISVAVVEVLNPIKVGDKIRIKGFTTDFEQTIDSMQLEHEKLKVANVGDKIGMKVKGICRLNDRVYLV